MLAKNIIAVDVYQNVYPSCPRFGILDIHLDDWLVLLVYKSFKNPSA
jgi:hypothetical protein